MNKKLLIIIFSFLILGAFVVDNNGSVRGIGDENLVVYFLDVGQGDATLIRIPNGNDILIDGGPDNTLIQKLGQYLPFYDRTIETIILTHPDSDHITGLVEVINRYDVEEIITTGVLHDTDVYELFLELVDDKNINTKIIDSPQVIDLGGGVNFNIFVPNKSFDGINVSDINNTSIAGKIIYASTSVMFTGDLETEEELLDLGFNLKSDIYKSGHHGASNANDKDFIASVGPKYSIISVGEDNRFGHPNYRTIRNLEKARSIIYRTDMAGDLIFYSNGHEFYKY
jgi:competence protein ComEC